MPLPSPLGRFRPHAVPLVLFAVVVVAVLLVPPLVLGGVTVRTYAITAAVLIVALGAVAPYALLIGVGTLPFLYTGVASYAAPRTPPPAVHPFSAATAVRHVAAGVVYVLGAAAVGAIGIGAQMSGGTTVPAPLQPLFLFVGGVVVAAVFVSVQLWRYDRPSGTLDWRTTLGTVVLGALLALSPAVALRVFNGTAG